MNNEEITAEHLLDMLGNILIEIRADSNEIYTKAMADIFHNVPARIINKIEAKLIYADMMRVAERHKKEEYLTKLLYVSQRKYTT